MPQVKVTFDHALYDTFTYQRGASLAVENDALNILLKSADTALDRTPGYFFEVLGDQFVFGFENQRRDEHSRHGSMAFFDLYAAPVADVRIATFTDLYGFFSTHRSDSLTTDIAPAIEYTEQDSISQRTDRAEHEGDADGHERITSTATKEELANPQKPSDDTELAVDTATIRTIADIWEHWRRTGDDQPVPVTFDEVAVLVQVVPGALSSVSFVSDHRRDASYFTLVGGQREEILAYDVLESYLRSLVRRDELHWDYLPSYQNEIDALRSSQTKELVTNGQERYDASFDEIFTVAQAESETIAERHLQDVQDILTQTIHGTLEPVDGRNRDGTLIKRVGGMFSSSTDNPHEDVDIDVEELVTQYRERIADEELVLDEQTQHAIVHHIIQRSTPAAIEAVENEIIQTLQEDLREAVKKEAIELAVETAKRTDTIYRTTSYELGKQTGTDSGSNDE